jgi:predicted acylesterase/phospholipase RssA
MIFHPRRAGQPAATEAADLEPRRALVLAGGGMRVAWQAGAIRALTEAGLSFGHADGTSGGIINLAMLLSGLSPEAMCRRWETLDVHDFASPMPLKDYLAAPDDLMALGDADGLRAKVFPHLGIDVRRVNAGLPGMTATFNLGNFTDKTSVALEHHAVDLDLLVAGVSLPIFMPPVHKDGVTWTDAVWIKDANLLEAVRRGADELWLLWCIGNTGRYQAGLLEQYVHMIELSANGALFGELEQIAEHNRALGTGPAGGGRRPVRVHVVKPEYPLPLDPDFYLGRIDASTLVAMGYRDANAYLAAMQPEGVPLDPSATKMRDPGLGLRFRERLSGTLAMAGGSRDELHLDLVVEIAEVEGFVADPSRGAPLAGRLRCREWGEHLLTGGRFWMERGASMTRLVYEARFVHEGRSYRLVGDKTLRDDPGPDLWGDVTTLEATLLEQPAPDSPGVQRGAALLRLDGVRQFVSSFEPVNAHGGDERRRAVAAFGRMLLGELWKVYA